MPVAVAPSRRLEARGGRGGAGETDVNGKNANSAHAWPPRRRLEEAAGRSAAPGPLQETASSSGEDGRWVAV